MHKTKEVDECAKSKISLSKILLNSLYLNSSTKKWIEIEIHFK